MAYRLIRIFLFLLLISAQTAGAQELRITEARRAMEPMTVPMQRLDFNNEICALVKVLLPMDGVKFEGNVVGDPVFKTNEYWVYLTPGTKMLNIKAPGYYPVMADFRDLELGPLDSKTIYYLTVKPTGNVSASKPAAPTTNYVVMKVTPTTATVEIDGQPREAADGSVTALLKLGEHTYTVKAAGYQPQTGSFLITDKEKTHLQITLKSEKATLNVATLPDVEIYLDGTLKGKGRWNGELLPGLYSVELRRAGHRTVSETVELHQSETRDISQTEFTPVYSSLTVDYRPVDATIKLDGNIVGQTPDRIDNVLTGEHQLSIEAPGYRTHTQKVTLAEGEPMTLTGTLQKTFGNSDTATDVELSTTPINESLCVERDDQIYYVTALQWDELPNRYSYTKRGLCIVSGNERFLLSLNYSRGMNWVTAMKRYGDALPSKSQAEIIGANLTFINRMIQKFGGTPTSSLSFWTKTKKSESMAWTLGYDGQVKGSNMSGYSNVRTVSPIPERVTPDQFSAQPIDMALCVQWDGHTGYVTERQWMNLTDSQKKSLKKLGVCVISGTTKFLVDLYHGHETQWCGSGPSLAQARIMAKNHIAINNAIKSFDGDSNPEFRYWTRESKGNSEYAWLVDMKRGEVVTNYKVVPIRTREVYPLPE